MVTTELISGKAAQECLFCGLKTLIFIQTCHARCSNCGREISCDDSGFPTQEDRITEEEEIKRFIVEGPEQREDSV